MEETKYMVDKSTQIEQHELPTGCSTPNCSRNTRRSALKYPYNGSSCQDVSSSVVKVSLQEYSDQKLSEIRNRMLPYSGEEEKTEKRPSLEKNNTQKRLSKPSVSFSNIHNYVEIHDDQDITEEEMEEDQQDSLISVEESSMTKMEISELASPSSGLTKDAKEILRSSFQGIADEIIRSVISEAVNVQLKRSSLEDAEIFDEDTEASTIPQIAKEDEEHPHSIYNITLRELSREGLTPISSKVVEVQIKTEQLSRSPITLDVIDFTNENEILKHISPLHSKMFSKKGELEEKEDAGVSGEKSETSITSESSDDNREVIASKRIAIEVNFPKHHITLEENDIEMLRSISPIDVLDENDDANVHVAESHEQSEISRPQYKSTHATFADNVLLDVSSVYSGRLAKYDPDSHISGTDALRRKITEDTLVDNAQIEVSSVLSERPGVYNPDIHTSDTKTLRNNLTEGSVEDTRNVQIDVSSVWSGQPGVYGPDVRTSDNKTLRKTSREDALANNVQIDVSSVWSGKPGFYGPDVRTSDIETLRKNSREDALADYVQIDVSSVFSEKPVIQDPDSHISDIKTLSNEFKYKELLRLIDEERTQKLMNDNKTEESDEKIIDMLSFDHQQSVDDGTNTEIRRSSWKYDGMVQPEFVEPISSSMKPYAISFEDEENETDRTQEVSNKSSELRDFATREYILDKLAEAEGRRRPISFSFDQPMGSDVSRSSGILSNSLEIPGYRNVVTSSRNVQRILDGRYFSLNEVHVFWDQMKKECLFIRSLFLFLLYYLIYLTLYCGFVHKCVC